MCSCCQVTVIHWGGWGRPCLHFLFQTKQVPFNAVVLTLAVVLNLAACWTHLHGFHNDSVFTMTHAWVPLPWDLICPGGRLVHSSQHTWSTEHYPSRNAEFADWEHYLQFWSPLSSYTQCVLFGGEKGGCAICRIDPHSIWQIGLDK